MINKLCKCGCGKKVRLSSYKYVVCHHGEGYGFKKGHTINLGKKRGKMPKKWKEKISISMTGIPSHRKGMSMEKEYGKEKTNKIINKINKTWINKTKNEMDEYSQKIKKE